MKKDKSLSIVAVISLFFMVLFFIFNSKHLLYISALFLFLVAFPTFLTELIAKYWMMFGKFLGNINSKIILFITYFIFITPIAFLFRIFNKKTVDKFKKDNTSSMFQTTNRDFLKDSFEKPF